jgi:hypothetical protein
VHFFAAGGATFLEVSGKTRNNTHFDIQIEMNKIFDNANIFENTHNKTSSLIVQTGSSSLKSQSPKV